MATWNDIALTYFWFYSCLFLSQSIFSVYRNMIFLVSYVRMLTWFLMVDFVIRTTHSGFSSLPRSLVFTISLKPHTNLSIINLRVFAGQSLILSWRRFLSYRNQSIDLLCKSLHWFPYDWDLRHERVKVSK